MSKKFIKFFMTDKSLNTTLPMEKAEKVINHPNQVVMLLDDNGKWTGKTINKAYCIGTDHDAQEEEAYERKEKLAQERMQLRQPYKDDYEIVDTEKYKPDFLKALDKAKENNAETSDQGGTNGS